MIVAISEKHNGLSKECIMARRLPAEIVFWVYSQGQWPPLVIFSVSEGSQLSTGICPVPGFLLEKCKGLAEMKCSFPPAGHKGQTVTISANGPWDIFFDSWFYSFTPACIWMSLVPQLRPFSQLQPWQVHNIALAAAVNASYAFPSWTSKQDDVTYLLSYLNTSLNND